MVKTFLTPYGSSNVLALGWIGLPEEIEQEFNIAFNYGIALPNLSASKWRYNDFERHIHNNLHWRSNYAGYCLTKPTALIKGLKARFGRGWKEEYDSYAKENFLEKIEKHE